MILGYFSHPGNDLADTLAKVGTTHDPSTNLLSLHLLFLSNAYFYTSIGDAVFNLVSSNRKLLLYLLRSLSLLHLLCPLLFTLQWAQHSSFYTSAGLAELRLLAATVVPNHKISFILC